MTSDGVVSCPRCRKVFISEEYWEHECAGAGSKGTLTIRKVLDEVRATDMFTVRLNESEELLLVKRLLLRGDEPVALLHNYLPLSMRERADVLRAAIGFALGGATLGLDRFRETFAAKMAEGPLARVILPRRIPHGFHATFVSQSTLNRWK